eukprot:gene10698-14365_t
MNGLSNHHFISTSTFIGIAKTTEKFAMYVSTYPTVNANIPKTYIYGEIYRVDDEEVLADLDRLEGHPIEYIRTPIFVTMLNNDTNFDNIDNVESIPVEIYFNNHIHDDNYEEFGCECIVSGNYHDFIKNNKLLNSEVIREIKADDYR